MNIKKVNQKFAVKHFEKIDSTHRYVKDNYKKLENKTVVIAEVQTNGIGTKNRNWYTGEGKNIAISILYKPNFKIDELDGITVNIAKKIQKVIFNLYNVKLEIKEPNDLMLRGKKIAGILTQINTRGEEMNYLIISVGFNVNETEFNSEIGEFATSLKKEYLHDFNRREIISNILEEVDKMIEEL